jgi:RNA polymerase sigma-70 factor, ECF subfamily
VPINHSDLESIYRHLEVALFNVALRWVFNAAVAEDLVHEAFIRIWNKRDTVEIATLKGLLFKTVQNLAINEARKIRLRSSPRFAEPILEWFRTESAPADQDRELADLRAAMERLPFELREVIVLSEFSEMSYEEIGAALGVPAGTVGSRKNRALRLMREMMKEAGDEQMG